MLRLLTAVTLILAVIWLIRRLRADTRSTPVAQPTPLNPGSRAEALAVLGLTENASRDDIVAAHRQLMQLHPDRGGNDFLAAQINRAKEILLG